MPFVTPAKAGRDGASNLPEALLLLVIPAKAGIQGLFTLTQ